MTDNEIVDLLDRAIELMQEFDQIIRCHSVMLAN